VTTLTGRVDTAEITRQAKEIRPGETALTLIGVPLWAIGWVTAKLFRVLWAILSWSFVAVRTGWREAHGKKIMPDVKVVLAENDALRHELARSGGAEILSQNAAMSREIERLRTELERLSAGVPVPG